MTQDTRELLARALRAAAEKWEQDAGNRLNDWSPDARRQTEREAYFVRGFAEALENGCSL